MTAAPRISDEEVEAFVALTKKPMGLKAALAAFLRARVPERRLPDDGNGDDDDQNRGFNACRDAVWNGKTPA